METTTLLVLVLGVLALLLLFFGPRRPRPAVVFASPPALSHIAAACLMRPRPDLNPETRERIDRQMATYLQSKKLTLVVDHGIVVQMLDLGE